MEKLSKKLIFTTIKSYTFITFGLFLYAFAWVAFIIPAQINGGGVSGIATVIYFASGFPVGYSILLINGGLVLVGMRILGTKFGINTIYGIVMVSVFFIILPKFITEPIVKEQFMASLVGSILSGLGLGITISNGGNSGGTDILALIINKYRNVTPGKIYMYSDVVIISSTYLVFGSIEKIVYGFVVMAVTAYTVDSVLEGAKQSYQYMIFSKESATIADRVGNEIGRGITFLRGHGWYTKEDRDVLVIIARKHDRQIILKIIKDTDPQAFISVAKVNGVYGNNFEPLKL